MPVHLRKLDTKMFSLWFLGRTIGHIVTEYYFVAIISWILFVWYLKLYINRRKK